MPDYLKAPDGTIRDTNDLISHVRDEIRTDRTRQVKREDAEGWKSGKFTQDDDTNSDTTQQTFGDCVSSVGNAYEELEGVHWRLKCAFERQRDNESRVTAAFSRSCFDQYQEAKRKLKDAFDNLP